MGNKFIKANLAGVTFVDVTTALSVPENVREIEFRNSSGTLEVRNSDETTKIDTYAQDEVYLLERRPGEHHGLAKLQIKGAQNDVILGEYVV